MSERPILFSAPMVRAILDDRKTQTRRIIKPVWKTAFGPYPCGINLWVRETFAFIDNSEFGAESYYQYRADTDGKCFAGDWPQEEAQTPDRPKWKPSIHMPRKASRIILQITGTRPERLNDISEADAIAEGCMYDEAEDATAADKFADLWESINGKGSWDANPLVWVIEFKRAKP